MLISDLTKNLSRGKLDVSVLGSNKLEISNILGLYLAIYLIIGEMHTKMRDL